MAEAYPKVFVLVMELAMKVSPEAAPLYWEYKVERDGVPWWFAINGGDSPRRFEPPGSMGLNVPPYSVAVICNGWIAGIVDAHGGGLINTEEADVVAVLESELEAIGAAHA